jgi:hypothetical protein
MIAIMAAPRMTIAGTITDQSREYGGALTVIITDLLDTVRPFNVAVTEMFPFPAVDPAVNVTWFPVVEFRLPRLLG